MPAVKFHVQWPDGEKSSYYSPSTVIHQYFYKGDEYPLDDFMSQCVIALDMASERVRERFGYYCSAASDEKKNISNKYSDLQKLGVNGVVKLIGFD